MTTGVVVCAYGSPRTLDDLAGYYTHIRRGRPPSAEQLAEVRSRYEAIGGSPLRERTERQAAALAAALGDRDGRYTVAVGYKHAPPFVEDAVSELVNGGARHIVVVPMTPHHSPATVGSYVDRARRAAGDTHVAGVGSWHVEPALVGFLASEVRRARVDLPARTKVLFTAHSLPERIVAGDAYPALVTETAAAVAAAAGLAPWSGWAVAWQSAGLTDDAWLGPDVLTTMADLGATGRADGVVVCPCGFAADHLEVLYDLDVDARRAATQAGLAFARTAVVNDDAGVMAALADRIAAVAGAAGGEG